MRTMTAIAITIGLAGCATSASRPQAADICVMAGFEPTDADYADCVQYNQRSLAQLRREKLRKELEIADRASQQAGVKFFYNGPTLGRAP